MILQLLLTYIRGYPEAHLWLSGIDETLSVSHFVWLEVIQGAQNKQKQASAMQILADFDLIEITSADTQWAVQALTTTRLAHNVDALDSLIASVSFRLQISLYTRNMKHFMPLLDDLAQKPYSCPAFSSLYSNSRNQSIGHNL